MNSEETTRSQEEVKMTGTTFHRELESDAVFHISPTRFHFPAAATSSSSAALNVAGPPPRFSRSSTDFSSTNFKNKPTESPGFILCEQH